MALKKLVGETLIYGLSSILGRFANFLLVPLYTWVLLDSEFGDIAWFYALMGFLKILFTLQLDTAFFRFGREASQRMQAYVAILRPVSAYILLVTSILLLLSPWLAEWTGFPGYAENFYLIAIILGIDAFTEFPLARMRLEQRPYRFVAVRLTAIGITILANVAFLWLLPQFFTPAEWRWLYPQSRLTLVLWANLMGSLAAFLLIMGDLRYLVGSLKRIPFKPILVYASPLILVSFAGVINEMLDRQLLKVLLPGSLEEVRSQIGIYSATYRLAMLITLFTQAFRYAAEPFFFRQALEKNAPEVLARVTRYYTLAVATGFLAVMLFLPWIKFFIGREGSSYHEGLWILPILLLANVFLGLYYNFSVWYKVTDKTRAGAIIAVGGAFITILGNVLLIPYMGYAASAWTTLVCYGVMTMVCYFWGQRYYPIPYPLGRMFAYLVSAGALTILFWQGHTSLPGVGQLGLAVGLFIVYGLFWLGIERNNLLTKEPLSSSS
jgi:O-antigen/teichoic acid export membrane protein